MNETYIIDIETLGLEPWDGKVVCIVCFNIKTKDYIVLCEEDEKKLLGAFWEAIQPNCTLIGYNSDSFDIPFIIKRSLIRNIKMKKLGRSIDLRKIVNGFWFSYDNRVKGKLSDWARVLHKPVETHQGSEIFGLYRKKDFESIKEHCKEDVILTYELFKRCRDSNLIKYLDK